MLKDIFIIAKYFHDFYLYTFTIQKDHVHLLIQPLDDKNISQIIKFIKQNFTQNINYLSTQQTVGADSHPRRNKKKQTHVLFIIIYSTPCKKSSQLFSFNSEIFTQSLMFIFPKVIRDKFIKYAPVFNSSPISRTKDLI